MPKNELTEREIIVLQFYLLTGEKASPIDVYRAAYDGSLEKFGALVDPYAAASRWIRSKRVLEYLNDQRAVIEARREAERAALEEEIMAGMNLQVRERKRQIDYSNPANAVAKLNRIVSTSQDTGEQIDALKLILSRQSELNPGKKPGERPVRYYVPLVCNDCPLYEMGKDVLELRTGKFSETKTRAVVEKYVNKLLNK